MEVIFIDKYTGFIVKENINNQTFIMGLEPTDWNDKTIYLNLYITLYNKRKDIDKNENLIKTTGLNPAKTISTAIKAFKILEEECLNYYNEEYNVIIYCTWLDKRRRDIYYRYLSRFGYKYGKHPYDNFKYIYKKYEKK